MANETITAAKGFLAAGVACGIKKSGKLDLGVIHCPAGATAAAVFTTNRIVSASVQVCREHVRRGKVYGVVVNSGNANACTGKRGFADAVCICRTTADNLGSDSGDILVASTGIIGERLPVRKITAGIRQATAQLSASGRAGRDFAAAIMTTDTRVITTDVAIRKPLLQRALRDAIGRSLNKLTVDGHQSTNDTAMILASGAADNPPITSRCPRYRKLAKALGDLCEDLVRQMALDAEGATRMFKVLVKGAASKADAAKAARAVADYDLVKCAVHGADPNWGRIVCAVGSCGVKLNPDKVYCKIGEITVFRNGRPIKFDTDKAINIIRGKYHCITIGLGAGKFTDFCYGCDLTKEYVTINADYHT